MSSLKNTINEQMKAAMKAKDKPRLDAIRLILTAMKQIEVDERIELDDTRILAILDKMVKQRRDSIEQFISGGRQELADKEQFEIDVIQEFMPEQLSTEEVRQLIDKAIQESGATSIKDMGKVMAVLKPQLQGRADLGTASALIKEKLA